MKHFYLTLLALLCLSFTQAQIVNIYDYNFQQKLIDFGVDTNFNGFIEVSEAEAVTELFLDCDTCIEDEKINSLEGIESFVNLIELTLSNNLISDLDLSANINLTYLDCSFNFISNLDVSSNLNLFYLQCNNNFMSTLNVDGCDNLSYIICLTNNLTNLDVSSNLNLDYFDCSYNNLTNLDASANTTLGSLRCHHMPNLTSMNLKNGTGSTYYIIDSNPNLASICIDDFGVEPSRIQYAVDNYDYPNCDIITDCASLDVSEFEFEQVLEFYPNPTQDLLNIRSKYNFDSIEIFDLQGNTLKHISVFENQTDYTVSMSNFSTGVYLIKLSTSNGQFIRKIIKN